MFVIHMHIIRPLADGVCSKTKLETGKSTSLHAEAVFDKISDTRNKTYLGLISMPQGFQKCIA